MNETQITLTHDKTTKNTERFATGDAAAVVDTVYVKKTAFPDGQVPANIAVTIQAAN